MLKIDRQSWHYKLVRWAWGTDKWSVLYLMGRLTAIPGWRREILALTGQHFEAPKGLCAYLWMLLLIPLLVMSFLIIMPVVTFATYVIVLLIKAVGWLLILPIRWLLILPIRLLAARTGVTNKAASTWQIVAEGAKAAHTHTCPRIEYVGDEQKEGVA